MQGKEGVSDSDNSGECFHKKKKVEFMSKPKSYKVFSWEKRSKLRYRDFNGWEASGWKGNF